jgi:hypothetical protein
MTICRPLSNNYSGSLASRAEDQAPKCNEQNHPYCSKISNHDILRISSSLAMSTL